MEAEIHNWSLLHDITYYFHHKDMYSLLASKGGYLDTERKVREYLKSLPNEKVKIFYENIELTPFPIMLVNEYKKRFSKEKMAKTRSRNNRRKRRTKTGRLARKNNQKRGNWNFTKRTSKL